LYSIQHVRKKPDLIDGLRYSLGVVVLYKEYVLPVSDILQVQVKSLRQFAFTAVRPEAKPDVQPEIAVQPLGIVMQRIQYLVSRRHGGRHIDRSGITPFKLELSLPVQADPVVSRERVIIVSGFF